MNAQPSAMTCMTTIEDPSGEYTQSAHAEVLHAEHLPVSCSYYGMQALAHVQHACALRTFLQAWLHIFLLGLCRRHTHILTIFVILSFTHDVACLEQCSPIPFCCLLAGQYL